MSNIETNKRIAQNTIFLYFRMFLTMGISLYTSRVILKTLGVEDYGINNVVGGVILLFTFIDAAMSGATQRFLNYEMGKNNEAQVSKIFSMSLTVHIILAFLVVALGETVGLWFVYHYIHIPESRFEAALWVYHFSVLGTFVGIIKSCYNASIVAFEKMSFYAYISIFEGCVKLLIVFLLVIIPYDKLKTWVFLTFTVHLIISYCFKLYCNNRIKITIYHSAWDKILLKKILSFSGWSLFGSTTSICVTQGLNIFQNIFFGVRLNAAMGIASQVNNAVWSFCSNFQMAFKPQIVKLYASGEEQALLRLIYRSSKISFFLLYIISLPLIIYCENFLSLWLGVLPEYAVNLTRLILINSLIEGIASPLWMMVQAVGKIKRYQLLVSAIMFLNLPISYIALKLGNSPDIVFVIQILLSIVLFVFRLFFLQNLVRFFTVRQYLVSSILPCVIVLLLTIPFAVLGLIIGNEIFKILIFILLLLFYSLICILFIGLDNQERNFIISNIKSKLRK